MPFVILFVIFALFYLINKNNFSYNISNPEQESGLNIGTFNKQADKLNIIPSRKGNNSKIMDYIFEKNEIKEHYNHPLVLRNTLLMDNKDIGNINKKVLLKNVKIGITNLKEKKALDDALKKLQSQKNELTGEQDNVNTSAETPVKPPVEPSSVPNNNNYLMLKTIRDLGRSDDSKLKCNGDNNITVANAILACDKDPDDCNGFFNYDSSVASRTCFKKAIDLNETQMNANISLNPNSAFYYRKPPVEPSPVPDNNDYLMLKTVLDLGKSVDSNLKCNNNITVADAIAACDKDKSECKGFFNYDSSVASRTCFKKGIDLNETQMNANKSVYPNSAFYYRKQ
jgi:hypothetical protein